MNLTMLLYSPLNLHVVAQHRRNQVWKTVSQDRLDDYWAAIASDEDEGGHPWMYEQSRWRDLANHLVAGRSINFGTNAVDRIQPVYPFFPARGFPRDVSPSFIDPPGFGASWLTLDELLRVDWQQNGWLTGYVALLFFRHRVANEITGIPDEIYMEPEPKSVRGAISERRAREFLKMSEQQQAQTGIWEGTMVRLRLRVSLAQIANEFYADFIPLLRQIDSDPKRVRIVYTFN